MQPGVSAERSVHEAKTVKVRAFRRSDQDQVVSLWRAVFPDAPRRNDPVLDIQRKLTVQPDLFLVADRSGEVAGTCVAGFDGHRGWVHLVAVDPEMRRQGIGSALIQRAETLLAELGCPKLNLRVRASTPEAVPFYRSLGFQVEDRISMGKVLSPATAPTHERLRPRSAGPARPRLRSKP